MHAAVIRHGGDNGIGAVVDPHALHTCEMNRGVLCILGAFLLRKRVHSQARAQIWEIEGDAQGEVVAKGVGRGEAARGEDSEDGEVVVEEMWEGEGAARGDEKDGDEERAAGGLQAESEEREGRWRMREVQREMEQEAAQQGQAGRVEVGGR